MNDWQQSASGLVVPKEPPPKPTRHYGPLEIQDADNRELAKQGLSLLVKALELHKGRGGIQLPGDNLACHRAAWDYLAEMLLGEDMPTFEEWT